MVRRLPENTFFLDFSWIFRVSWGVLKRYWLERYSQLSFMRVCKYLNQRVRRIEEWNENLSRVFKKQKKTYMKKLNSIIQDWDFYYRSRFLLPFTSFRKVLGKMPGFLFVNCLTKQTEPFNPKSGKQWKLGTGQKIIIFRRKGLP